jgi:hypothetical protein
MRLKPMEQIIIFVLKDVTRNSNPIGQNISKNMFKDKFILFVVVFTVLLLAIGALLLSRASEGLVIEPTESVKVSVDNTFYDWGEIGIKNGSVLASFNIKNEGESVLKLYGVTTSCACTNATLKLGEKASPEFGMHTKSNYVMEVPVGETAELKVVFDPAFHGPNGIGKIDRVVKVSTNDINKPKLNFNTSALVVN